jgi:hypothetical protein
MTSNWWPWSPEEEAEWQREAQQQSGWMDELIDHMVSDGLAGSCYDPLQPRDEAYEEEVVAP